MNRQYSRYDYTQKKVPVKNGQRLIWRLAILLGIGLAGFFAYQHYHRTPDAVGQLPFVSGIKSWFAKRHEHLQQGIIKVKQRTHEALAEEAPPIHFEFYKTLPQSQVLLPEIHAENAPSSTSGKKKIEIANADELERDLSSAVAKATANNH